jgi:choice-of-anchor B domain-containing protein
MKPRKKNNKMKYFTTAIFAVAFTIGMNAQTECIDGMAGEYACSGYDLISTLSLGEMGISSNGNDCWGWTDPEDGVEYALMGGNNRTVFIDISDPVNPVIIGHLETASSPSLWRDIKVYNDHAFIVSEASGHGMQVFDLTRLRDVVNPPVTFDVDAYFDEFGHAHNIAINEETGYAYPIGAGAFNGGPIFVNIQDPLNPVSEGGYDGDGYSHDAQIVVYNGPDTEHVGKEIYLGFNTNSLTIVDITDKSDPIQLSRTTYDQSAYTHQGWMDEDHIKVYMNDEIDESDFGFNTRTLIMDCTDLDEPVLQEEHFGETASIDHNLYVKGDNIFQSNYTSGLRVLQINDDEENPLEEVGFFDVYPANDATSYSGTWSNYPYFESGNVIISSFDGFFIVKAQGTGVGVEEFDVENIEVYPNPAQDNLNISIPNNLVVEKFTITDITGRVIMAKTDMSKQSNIYTIDVSNLLSGTYFIGVNDNSTTKKFVVQ